MIPRAIKTAFKLAANDIQALSSLIGLPPVMERVIAGARKREREKEGERGKRDRERPTDRQREWGGGGER